MAAGWGWGRGGPVHPGIDQHHTTGSLGYCFKGNVGDQHTSALMKWISAKSRSESLSSVRRPRQPLGHSARLPLSRHLHSGCKWQTLSLASQREQDPLNNLIKSIVTILLLPLRLLLSSVDRYFHQNTVSLLSQHPGKMAKRKLSLLISVHFNPPCLQVFFFFF